MDLGAFLRMQKFGVCGCPGFWNPGSTPGPDEQQEVDIYHPHHYPCLQNITPTAPTPLLSLSTLLLDSPLDPSTTNQTCHFSPPHSTHDVLSLSLTPPGPPQETCFFWYHGDCRRGDNCARVHQTHVTWPIPPPPEYTHWKPCYLPLCPMKEGMAELMRPCGEIVMSVFYADVEAGARMREDEKEVESSNTAVQNENKSGELTVFNSGSSDYHGCDNDTNEPGRHVDNEGDIISLPSGSYNSTTTSSSTSPFLSATPTLSSFLQAIDEQPTSEVISIDHTGTYEHRQQPGSKASTLKSAAHPLPAKPMFGPSTESPRENLHTSDTDAKETSVPANLEFDQVHRDLSLFSVRLRDEKGEQISVEDKVEDEEEELTKDAYGSMIPWSKKSGHSSVENDEIIFQRVKKQYYDRRSQLISLYGSWQAVPYQYARPIQQLQDAIRSWGQKAHIFMPQGNFRQEIIALGNMVQEQKRHTKVANAKRRRKRKPKAALAHMAGIQKAQAQKTAPTPAAPKATIQEPFLRKRVAKMNMNPNLIPVSKKRKASIHDSQMTGYVAKRAQPTHFDVLPRPDLSHDDAWSCHTEKTNDNASKNSPYMSDETERVFTEPEFVSEFLATNMVSQKRQVQEKKPVPGELVDYRLPSGDDRAEWDTDFLRRAFGEIE